MSSKLLHLLPGRKYSHSHNPSLLHLFSSKYENEKGVIVISSSSITGTSALPVSRIGEGENKEEEKSCVQEKQEMLEKLIDRWTDKQTQRFRFAHIPP